MWRASLWSAAFLTLWGVGGCHSSGTDQETTEAGREAAQASIDWGWANTEATRILAWTTAGNTASLAVMRSLGMVRRAELDFRLSSSHPSNPLAMQIVHAVERPA